MPRTAAPIVRDLRQSAHDHKEVARPVAMNGRHARMAESSESSARRARGEFRPARYSEKQRVRDHLRTARWATIVGIASAAGAAGLVALLGSDVDVDPGLDERHDDW